MNCLIACVLSLSCLMSTRLEAVGRGAAAPGASAEAPCAEGSFTAEEQPESPARLSVVEAVCEGPRWRARLRLANTGDKVIRGYEIENVEEYEHKKGVKSSQGGGVRLGPGESEEIAAGGGFRDGRSYGRPTGDVRKNVFRVTRVEFTDGTSWRPEQK